MKARFNTPCNACGGQIKVGQEIAKNNQGNWVAQRMYRRYKRRHLRMIISKYFNWRSSDFE